MNAPTIPGVYHITPGHTQLTESEERRIEEKRKLALKIIEGTGKGCQ